SEGGSRVAILGAGAMGTLFASHLAHRHPVTLVDVRGDVVDTINGSGGVTLDDGPIRRVLATRDPARAFATNYLFVFVKAPNTLMAVRPFAGQLNPATPIVSLQNGLGSEEAIKTALGGTVPLVIGITNEAALAVGHGRSRRQGIGTTVVGSAGASTATVRAVQTLVAGAGLECSSAYDIRPHQWGKLLANAAINPISALTDAKNGIVASDPDAAELARAVTLEIAAVARASRINLPFGDPWEYVRSVVASSAEGRNSMTIDLAARLKTEIDYVNGAIVAAGRRYGVATPYNDALVRLVHARENAPRE
ncbi:MAG: 2-dehydropantoate 2-reductase, partial [Candidatus Eremiobacteraeota bacterium]|nr:2-dehydropantoate 2-reductase [Candidatus Eremiobacteraeota bacterium]